MRRRIDCTGSVSGGNSVSILFCYTSPMKLVIVPGFLGYADEPHHIDLMNRAQLAGIEAVTVESQELSSRNFEKYRLSSHINTINRALDEFSNEEIALVGVSLGGVAATIASSERKNIVRLACVVSPYRFATGDDMESRLDEWKPRGVYSFASSRYGEVDIPYEFVKDAQLFDARAVISGIKCPKMFLAASLDERVPFDLTQGLFNRACDPKIYRLINGMRHDYKNQPVFTKLVNDYILEFIGG